MKLEGLKRAPFNLDDAGLSWVEASFASLSPDQKLGQIMLPLTGDLSTQVLDSLLKYDVGGVHRFPSASLKDLRASAEYLHANSPIPPLLATDIEFAERSSVLAGTPFPNQLTVAATGDPERARQMGTIAAREGGYCGFNISWTPVVDLSVNFHNPVVNTRSFGSSPDTVAACTTAYFTGMRSANFPTVVKHWPGDGVDDRDQHFAATHNSLDLDEWRRTYGRVFKAVIEQGVQCIMAGHISLPAYTRSLGAEARSPATMPATLNADLNISLLRGEFGFNGVIVSDATGMVGFVACGRRDEIVPMCIENGCDILLFPDDLEDDRSHLKEGLRSGRLSQHRLDEAVLRVLGLKASIGLHETFASPTNTDAARLIKTAEHRSWATGTAEAAVTLVRDSEGLLPITPQRFPRILIAQLKNRMSPSGPLPQLQVARLLQENGFMVAFHESENQVDPHEHDLGMYLLAEEGLSGKETLHPHWEDLHGRFPLSMQRLWDTLPTIFVSLGTPYLPYHAPECKTFINAYSPILPVQEAVVKALTGQIPFRGYSPIAPYCGLIEAEPGA